MTKFKIGDKVFRIRFIDCFNKLQNEIHGLTVTKVDIVKGVSLPDYERIQAEKENHIEQAGSHFFQHESD